jgi:RNA polymerase sigma factor (sigma-70 family)
VSEGLSSNSSENRSDWTTVEAGALKHPTVTGLRGPSPLLRLQSDERLIALTRKGQHAAFETLFARYQSRLLAFCRHMLNSKEDAEDVLQEVFTAAFNAVLADERAINVRPWLYRIARNRSLNHLRRHSAVGVDSMDIHFAEGGISTGDKVLRRESFRQLIGDVQELPETQRTALLLREIDALSYEQIASAMETTVPSVKSLLVRARISLAEAAEARNLSCDEVRLELGEVAEGLAKLGAPARRHMRGCERCRDFRKHLKANNHALAAIFPVGPLLLFKKLVLTKLGSTASAAGGHVAGAGGATAGAGAASAGVAGAGVAGAAATATGGVSAAGGLITAGVGAIATKAAATLAAAALVTAGAVEADHGAANTHHHHHAPRVTAQAHVAATPLVAHAVAQPVSNTAATGGTVSGTLKSHPRRPHPASKVHKAPIATTAIPVSVVSTTETTTTPTAAAPPPPVTEVTSESTQLPTTTTTTTSTPVTPTTASTPTTGATGTPPPAITTTTSSASTPSAPIPAEASTSPTPGAAGTPQPTSGG